MNLKQTAKLNIAVLYGGPSSEREISMKSGTAVINALNNLGIKNIPVVVNKDLDWIDRIKKSGADFVFIALHGRFGEDGTVQSILDFLKIPYSGSGVVASAVSMNKLKAKEIFVANNIPTPKWAVLSKNVLTPPKLKYPVVVKPVSEGSAIGVSIAKNRKDIKPSLKKAFRYGDKAMLEEYVDGTEITVAILGRKALPVIEIVPRGKFYDFRSKYQIGMSDHIIPARIPEKVLKVSQKIAMKTFDALGCRAFGRADMKVSTKNKIYVLELNTIPGMTQTSLLPEAAKAAGMSFDKLILEMIKQSL